MKAARHMDLRGDVANRGLRLAAALTVVFLAACETQHTFVVRNDVTDAVAVHVESDWRLEIADCVNQELGSMATIDQTIAPNAEMCFSGPVVGAGDDYDILDHVSALRVARNAATCVDGTGTSVRDRFVREQDNYVLVVDTTLCP